MMKSSLLTFVGHVLQIYHESSELEHGSGWWRICVHDRERESVCVSELVWVAARHKVKGDGKCATKPSVAMIYENVQNENPVEFNFECL